jgi:molybdopterin-guanine dinucleotide biosynthesis protein A
VVVCYAGEVSDRTESIVVKPASAIILVGGRSARMGQAKATLRLGGTTLIERTIAELTRTDIAGTGLARTFEDIVVVAAPESAAIELPPLREVTIVHDDDAYQGPVGALARGLRAARHELAFACSCDLPMLRCEVASWLLSLMDGYDAVIPEVSGRLQPLHAAYRRRCAAALDAMLERGEHRLTAIADTASSGITSRIIPEAEYRRADPDALSCFNINTPEDYARAKTLAMS